MGMIPEDIKIKYDDWNEKKQELQVSGDTKILYFNEGDIWWCSLGINLGDETFGKGEDFRRPILIIKKLSNDLCIALPITSQSKKGTWFVDIVLQGEANWVMLHQIRMLHKKRFQIKMAELTREEFSRVKEKLEQLLKLSSDNHPACTCTGIELVAQQNL
jgi:mRNA interferase MazF